MDSRIETLLKALLNGDSVEDFEPQSRAESYLKSCILKEGVGDLPDPQSRLDALLYELAEIMPTLGSGDIQLQTKIAKPSIDDVVVRPDTGYALSKVTIEAVTSAIDANIKAENIKEGVSILGVSGSEKGYDVGYVDGSNKGYELGKKDEYDAFWEDFQDGRNRVTYKYAFAGSAWSEELLEKIKYPIIFPQESNTGTRNALGMFSYLNVGNSNPEFDMTEICKKIDFKGCKSASNVFQNAVARNITVDFSGCETLSNTFLCNDGGNLDYIKIKVSEKAVFGTNATTLNTFNLDTLTEIRFLEGSVIANSIKFTSDKLTALSVVSIIGALKKFAETDAKYLANTLSLHENAWTAINYYYKYGTEDIPLTDGATWQDYVLSIGWNV